MIYDRMRILRLPNTQHQDSARFKTPITYDELISWSINEILELSISPRPFVLPAPEGRTNPTMAKLWAKCTEMAAKKSAGVSELKSGPAKLFQDTTDFIINGACKSTRNNRLFAAAANLADFPDRNSLITALLFDPAMRSGLGEQEINRTIKNAVEGKR